jgi:uncharacterized glyoxalase superfamily protein PhnB
VNKMSEQFLVEQLDEALDAIIARGEVAATAFGEQAGEQADRQNLAELLRLGADLGLLPRESFKTTLRESLIRSTAMTTQGTTTATEPATHASAGDQTIHQASHQTIIPYLTVKRADELVDFVKQVFGGVEVFRTTGSAGGLHAEVTIGESKLMIGGYEAVEEIPTALHLYVPDADDVYRRALAAGAVSVEEPVDQDYGDREAGVKDPSGNIWWIATHKLGAAGTYIPEGLRPVTPFLHAVNAPGLIEFMQTAFAGEVVSGGPSPDGMVHHAVVRIGDSMIEMGEAHGIGQPMPPALYMYVENVEESYERALKAGATSMQAPTDQSYGERTAWVKDAWDNIWYLAQPTEKQAGKKGNG